MLPGKLQTGSSGADVTDLGARSNPIHPEYRLKSA